MEDNIQPDDVPPAASASEYIAARDFVKDLEKQPSGSISSAEEESRRNSSEKGPSAGVLQEHGNNLANRSIPEVAPQDPSVPDILEPSPAVAAVTIPANPSPSALPTRKWLIIDGKQGVWQYEPGNSRPRFVEKKFTSRLKDSNEETLLKAARLGHEDIVAILLHEQEAGTEAVEPQRRRTPILLAAEAGYAVIVQLLLDNGARWKATDSMKRTALHLASLNGRDDIVQLLLHRTGINVEDKDEQGNTALHLAARSGDEVAIRLLLDQGAAVQTKDKKGNTPLHLAAKKGLAAVETLLRIAATPVDEKSSSNRTPLMQACDRPPSQDSEDIAKLLIHNGANVSVCDNNEETPLFIAALNGNYRVVELLIQHHADFNALNIDGNSALFGPARLGYEETARVLLAAGIDSRVANKDAPRGRTALLESAKFDNATVALLILEKWTESGYECQDLVQSALFEAALYDSSKVARVLVERGANIGEKEPVSSKTPVEIANSRGSTKVVALLLEKGGQLFSQGPSLEAHMPETPSEVDPTPLMPVDSNIDLGFGFKSTIVSFFFDKYENSAIVRPAVQSVLYDHSPEAVKTGLSAAAGTDASKNNFRWLHIPGNNPVWVNNLITRIYRDCRPVEKSAYFQKKCKHLFGEEVWSRHQYQMSSTSVAHRRFIRPICQQIPIDKTDKDNMMMVLPYFHWETTKARDKMTNVIIEAMKSYIGDTSPSTAAKVKGLSQALKELERARNPDHDEEEASDSASSYVSTSYYNITEASTPTSSDRRTRRSSNSRKNDKVDITDEAEWISEWAERRDPETSNIGRSRSAAVTRPKEERRRKKRIEKIAELAKTNRSADDKLVLSYMFHETAPMHFRRTLDQYYYYTLPTTEARDKDQVITRYFERTWPGDDKLVLMVDQLWLWILDNDTIVTSFPQRWDKAEKQGDSDPDPSNTSDIVETVLRHVARTDRRPIESTLDLAELIASKCIGTMFEHPDIANDKLRFSEFFEISIGNVTNEESKMFDEFTELSKRLATGDHFAADLDMLFNISKETDLIKEIKDIRDELHIISTVLTDQEKVLTQMDAVIRAMKEGKVHEPAEAEDDTKDPRKTARTYNGLVGNVRRHIETVKGLDKQAEKTYSSLNDLLDLKQKQANVSEARSQRQQAQETARQGQTLMLFTVITVFFLPLSFLTTFFQLDIADYVRNGEGQLGLGYVSEITFPITAVVVAVSLVLAFRINLATVLVKALKSTWRGIKFATGLLVVIALVPIMLCIAFSPRRARPARGSKRIIIEEERYSRYGRPANTNTRYGKSLGHRGDKYLGSSFMAAIAGLMALLGLCRKSGAQRKRESSVIIEEGRRRRFGSSEVIVVEKRPHSRSRRGSRFPRRPSPPRRHPWFQPDSDEEVVVIEESPPPRRSSRRGSYSRPTPPKSLFARVWQRMTGLGLVIPGRKRELVEEERYWYGSRPVAQKRKKWPPTAWFKKQPTTVRRRTREIYTNREERRRPGFWQRFAGMVGIGALLGFKTSNRNRRGSRTSSLSHYSDSRRSSATSEDRTAAVPIGLLGKFVVWLELIPVWFLALFKGKERPSPSTRRSMSYGSGSTTSRRRRGSSSSSSDRRSRHSRRVTVERHSSRGR